MQSAIKPLTMSLLSLFLAPQVFQDEFFREICMHMFGVMFSSLVIGCEGVFVSFKAVQRISFCFMRICIGWVESNRPIVRFQCLIIFAQFAQNFSPMIMSRCMIRGKVT